MGQGGCPGSSKVAVTEANGVIQAVWSVDGLTFTQSISLMNTSSNESGMADNKKHVKGSGMVRDVLRRTGGPHGRGFDHCWRQSSGWRFVSARSDRHTDGCTEQRLPLCGQQGYMLTAILSAKQ